MKVTTDSMPTKSKPKTPSVTSVDSAALCSPFVEKARDVLTTAREELSRIHNRTLDRDGDYGASPHTFAALEGVEKLISALPETAKRKIA